MYKRLFALALTAIALVSCSRDPQVVKKKYLESGNKYFDRAKYKEASIMYRRAVGADAKYGEAWYRLALTTLRLGQPVNAIPSLRRAIELLPKGSKEYNDANLNEAEILLVYAQNADITTKNQEVVQDIEQITNLFLKQDPNSFEGHKLQGDLVFAQAVSHLRRNEFAEGKEDLQKSVGYYRETLKLRPNDMPTTLSLARSLALDGQNPEAEQLYRAVIATGKAGGAGYTELYRIYLVSHRLPEAEAILKKARVANPKDYNFATLLAAHYFNQNNKADGAKILDELKSNFKEYPQAYFTAGDFYLRMNDGAEAIRQYELGEKNDPTKKVDYQKRVVEVLMHDGKTAQAYDKNLEILKANPKDPEARGLKASFLIDKGDVNQALAELQSVVTARPDNFVARFHLGRAHFAKGEYEQARQDFEKSIEKAQEIHQDYLPARLALAQVALAQGQNEAALKNAQEALRISPQSGTARLLQGAALMRLQKYTESRASLNQILAGNPKQPDTLVTLGVLDLMEKKYQEASDIFRRAYEADPTSTRGLLGQAQSLMLLGQPESAIKLVQSEVQKYPKRLDLKRDLADLEAKTGHFDQAQDGYKDLLGSYKDNARQQGEIWARLSETYTRQQNLPKSIEALQKAKELMPDSLPVLNNLAILLDATGKHSDARKIYEQSVSYDPNDARVLNNLAYLMVETGGNLDQALTYANRAKQKLPEYSDISDTIGWIYTKKNLSSNAVDIFKDLVAKVPNKSTYHYHFAVALAQSGDKASASKQCELALASKPDKEEEARIRALMAKI